MVTLTLSEEQVIELFKQLPPEGKQAVLNALAEETDVWWDVTLSQGEQQMRRLAGERGLDWDQLSEVERETFIDHLLHEES